MALSGTEVVNVQGVLPNGIPSGQQFQTTTQAIANLGGGGGGNTNGQVAVTLQNGNSVIATGLQTGTDIRVPYSGTITGWQIVSQDATSGSIVIDVWKDTYTNYPPTIADTITGSALPTVSSATKAQSSTLTGWTTAVTAGDYLRFYVNSVTSMTSVTLNILITKS